MRDQTEIRLKRYRFEKIMERMAAKYDKQVERSDFKDVKLFQNIKDVESKIELLDWVLREDNTVSTPKIVN